MILFGVGLVSLTSQQPLHTDIFIKVIPVNTVHAQFKAIAGSFVSMQ